MPTTEAVLRGAIDARGERMVLTLDRRFSGLPETAHGGTVLAAFDAVARVPGPRRVRGLYRRRVPLAAALALTMARADGHVALRLEDGEGAALVEGRVEPTTLGDTPPVLETSAEAARGAPLPVSSTCFACGIANPLGLAARLRFDETSVFGVWTPPPRFRRDDGTLAAVAVTALLDEVAFWLGALATGESGMTTDLGVTLAGAIAFGDVAVFGERARVRPTGDHRYWTTATTARDASGRLVASADITFVAIRGAARKLASWVLPLNPRETVRRVFPAYVP